MNKTSTPFFLFFFVFMITTSLLLAQNDGVGIGVALPQSTLDVKGGVTIGEGYSEIYEAPDNGLIIKGDVGIGETVPLSKLHVYTVQSIHGILGESSMVTNAGIVGKNSNDFYGIGVIGISGQYGYESFGQFPYPKTTFDYVNSPGIGGSFAGNIGLYAYTNNQQAIGVLSENFNDDSYAGYFLGNFAVEGMIRNPDDSLYGGSVFVNDGLTVGDIEGGQCTEYISETCGFSFFNDPTNEPPIGYQGDWSPVFPNSPICDFGNNRKITNVILEVIFQETTELDIYSEVHLGDTATNSDNTMPCHETNNPCNTLVGYAIQSTITTDPPNEKINNNIYKVPFVFDTPKFNGEDPASLNWNFKYRRLDSGKEGLNFDLLHEYSAIIDYDYCESENIGQLFAAFGEIRASGTIYANSNSPYGDVAEFFEINANSGGRQPEPGDIVSFSLTRPETFELSNQPNDSYIAGVISENPSVFLNSPEQGKPIALAGRVRVKVNTEGGTIHIGDPITSSSIEGVGMRMNEFESGMMVGRAMQAFDGSRADEGKIWILLSKTHYERAKNVSKVVQGKDFSVGGVEVSGAKKVEDNETDVFIPWNENLIGRINKSDIDFDALVINLKPNGGFARLFVKNVNKDGIYVHISKSDREENFLGFYYNVKLIIPDYPEEENFDAHYAGPDQKDNYFNELSFDEKVKIAIDLDKRIVKLFNEIVEETGETADFTKKESVQAEDMVAFYKRLSQKSPEKVEEFNRLRQKLNQIINRDVKMMSTIHHARFSE